MIGLVYGFGVFLSFMTCGVWWSISGLMDSVGDDADVGFIVPVLLSALMWPVFVPACIVLWAVRRG